jgi:hypothetical protein
LIMTAAFSESEASGLGETPSTFSSSVAAIVYIVSDSLATVRAYSESLVIVRIVEIVEY